jgi:phosphoglucosamine mutase
VTRLRKLFGTDGIRGEAGVDLTESLARDLGAAAARFTGSGAAIVIGRDTRESGPALERALVEGIASAGGLAVRAGVIPTPGVAVLARETGAALGCVISASHNPYRDNGIKFIRGDGRKLPDADEAAIESLMDGEAAAGGDARDLPDAWRRHVDWLVATYGQGVDSGLAIGVDCANGAAFRSGPALFAELGERVEAIGCTPDGRNINAGVGSTHLEAVTELVAGRGLDVGIAFDGDADRCLAVDARGRQVNGDVILAVLAIDLHRRGLLAGGRVVVTTMTNLGFHRLMRKNGIAVEVTDVGDRYVLERMTEMGDGLATSLMLLGALRRLGMDVAGANDMLRPFPQRLVAVAADRTLLPSADRIWQEVDMLAEKLGDGGRIVLRASGTEPLVRVMVEAEDEAECRSICDHLARLVEEEIGVEEPTS